MEKTDLRKMEGGLRKESLKRGNRPDLHRVAKEKNRICHLLLKKDYGKTEVFTG